MFTNRSALFDLYYNVTENGFYNEEQMKRILRLIVYACGERSDAAEEMYDTVKEIRDKGVNDLISCQNALLVARFSDNGKELLPALNPLFQYYRSREGKRFSNENAWRRYTMTAAEPLVRGVYEYAQGWNAEAVRSFEKALTDGMDAYEVLQLLAVVSCEAELYEKALEYATRAFWADKDHRMEHPTMTEIEAIAKKRLGKRRSEEILASIVYGVEEKNKIGFV